ncbi:MAG TPA: DNRLRE domain-containing protein [Chloroflexi bacterium]|nr:DNRLRE domain-containing protein [Chloroflexota bacterium]
MPQISLRFSQLIAFVCAALLLLPGRAQAQVHDAAADVATLTLRPTQDTYVDSANPDANFADANVLRLLRVVLGQTTWEQQAYLRFDLSAIPPGAEIQSAELDLFQTAGTNNLVRVYTVASAWDASQTTWNRQPDISNLETWRAPATVNQYITYTSSAFLSLVQGWVNTPERNFGLMLASGATATSDGREFHSAENASAQFPRLRVTFILPPIRVCYDLECTKPAADAEVHNLTTDKVYTTDAQGLVQDDGVIQPGERLWARMLTATLPRGERFLTIGEAQTVDSAAFVLYPGFNQPEMHLVLQKPLFVRDLQVSTQWNLEGDPAYKTALTRRLIDASNHFYRFTDGQFALGRITVYQNYAHWNDPLTDLWLHASNAMRPLSYIKGEVDGPTPDPNPGVEFVYEPGNMYIGSEWNRFGTPPTQPLPPGVDVSHDWAAALAHELGHYLLGQFDSYVAVLPSGVVTETFACTGSAMGWVYAPENQAFVWDNAHWAAACGNTLGAFNVKRTEWQTIQAWHPWAQTPELTIPYTGTPPIDVTSVVFAPPVGPTPLASQVFDLSYQAGELASAEARAFLLRDMDNDGSPDRILDQGRPPQNVAPPQVTLTGAQAGDRLCVIDINDHAEAPDTPRHQFGCEIIAAGDALLTMRRDPSWAPVIDITPISPTAVGILVQQVTAGATVRARLYPEHDATPTTPITLTVGADGWSGVFTVPGLTPSAFVQVWIEEPADEENPRREAIVDYGIGGGAVPGPKQKIGFAPVTSSDGKAFFLLPANLSLTAEQFVAIQSMAGTLPLPPATRIFGQAYRLLSLPPALVAQGSINIYLANGSPGLATAAHSAAQEARALYFWHEEGWERLPTTFSTTDAGEVLASAESRGVGVYAVLIEAPNQLYLPALMR